MAISGMAITPAFMCIYSTFVADSIMSATDFLHSNMKDMVELTESLPICEGDQEKIFHANAERILKIA